VRTDLPQQVTRLPALSGHPIRPGHWVRLKDDLCGQTPCACCLCGKAVRVRSVIGALTGEDVKARVVWRICLEEGRSVNRQAVLRFATDREVSRAG
jgi:hypothetical protein